MAELGFFKSAAGGKKKIDDYLESVEPSRAALYKGEIVIVDIYKPQNDLEGQTIPMRTDAYSLVMVEKGELKLNIDYMPVAVEENTYLEIREQHLMQIVSISDDFKGYHMVVMRNFLRSLLENDRPPATESFNNQFKTPVTTLNKEEFIDLRNNLMRLRRNINRTEHPYQLRLIQNELVNIILEIWNFRVIKANSNTAQQKPTTRETITAQFFKLLLANSHKEREVIFYADKLHVTPVYLSRAIKHVIGMPAIKVINDIVLSDARALLRKPDMTIYMIAEELNFADQSSFSKFFKKHTGMSPKAYREKNRL